MRHLEFALAPALSIAMLFGGLAAAQAQVEREEKAGEGRLSHVATVARDDLGAVTSVEVSPDGKFLYASAWRSATHVVFRRDATTGKLEHLQTVEDRERLDGATALRLAKESDLAAAASFRSKCVVLYRRDKMSGELTRLDAKYEGIDGTSGLEFPIDASFSPDDRFIQVLDSSGGVTVFRVAGKGDERKLEFIEAFRSDDLQGVRGLAYSPEGSHVFAMAGMAGAMVVLKRDKMSGKLEIGQVVRDGEGEVKGLAGAFGVAVDPSGEHVYTVSGRFGGDESLGAFEFDAASGKLTLIEELAAGPAADAALPGFIGGNEIEVSSDGRNVYAVATVAGALAALLREPKSGKLVALGVTSGEAVAGAAGIGLSPDGKFVYVAAEEANAVSIYQRDIPAEKPPAE
jgi:6-phosphogluconolactonase (cycloisomerase 2 family)